MIKCEMNEKNMPGIHVDAEGDAAELANDVGNLICGLYGSMKERNIEEAELFREYIQEIAGENGIAWAIGMEKVDA